MEKQELIWVDKEFSERWKKLTDDKATRDQQEAALAEYMNTVSAAVKRDYAASLESLEEDAAIFTGLMLKVKQAFEKAKDEHLTASYELWEKFDAEIPAVRQKIDTITKTLKPLKDELAEINTILSQISTYDIDRFVKSVQNLSETYGTQKEMIEFLVAHFKRD